MTSPPPAGPARFAARVEQGLFAFFLAILVWAPLPFASSRPWAAGLLAALLYAALALWLLLALAGQARLAPAVWQRARWALALLLLVQAWVWLQTVDLPRSWVQWLSPRAFDWHIRPGPLPLSLDPERTREQLLLGGACSAAFFLSLALVNAPSRLRLLLLVLALSGTFQAAFGAYMVLSGQELGFLVEKYAGRGVATGTFVNRNHLAGYLVLCLGAGIGLLLSQLEAGESGSGRARLRRWLRLLLSTRFRVRVCLAVMVVALVLTRSRTGNVAFFIALAVAGALALHAGRRFAPRVLLFLGSLVLVDTLILGQWFGLDRLAERLASTDPAAEARVLSNADGWRYLQDFSVTGSGQGAFPSVFPVYQSPDLPGFYRHAHNDYLEFAVELGLPATVLLAAFVVLGLWQGILAQRGRSRLSQGAGFAVVMGVAWAALHSATDFNLQIPANAVTFLCILALGYACPALRQPAREPRHARASSGRSIGAQ